MTENAQLPRKKTSKPDGSFEAGTALGISALVSLQARSVANRIEERFPLNLTLEVDEWHVELAKPAGWLDRFATNLLGSPVDGRTPVRRLRIRLRHCYVRVECQGLSIVTASKYRSAIEVGTYSEKGSSTERSVAASAESGSIGIAASLDPKPKMSLNGNYRFGSKLEGNSVVERSVAVSQDIYEVEAVPGGWRVGDKVHGDPLKRDGCLDGPYFTNPVDGHRSTCELLFDPDRQAGTVKISVTTRDGLYVDQAGVGAASEQDKVDAIGAMRNKLAAICLESEADEASEMQLLVLECTCAKAIEEKNFWGRRS